VFPFGVPQALRTSKAPIVMRRKVRAQGISAEPQDLPELQQLIKQTLDVCPKSDE
jgi:hypothetical protein